MSLDQTRPTPGAVVAGRSPLALRMPRFASAAWARDAVAVGAIVALTLVYFFGRALPLEQYLHSDWIAFFFSVFGFLGERLRQGEIPLWNPYWFSGAPFLADPESGWGYLPAMTFFTLLPLRGAVVAFLLFHALMGGLGTYALGRTLGLGPLGSFAAGLIVEFTWLWESNSCCIPFVSVAAWLPFALIGVERSVRAPTLRQRAPWSILAALAVWQILASWLGQGSYYALLLIGAYALYRLLVWPPDLATPFAARRRSLVVVAAPIFVLGILLDASSLLPALQTNAETNLAYGAYEVSSQWLEEHDALTPWTFATLVLGGHQSGQSWALGGVTIVLAGAAAVVARRWFALPFLLAASFVTLALTIGAPNPVLWLFSALVPLFDTFHLHVQERILTVGFLPIGLLAGATLDRLPSWRPRSWKPVALAGALPAAVLLLGVTVGEPSVISLPTMIAIAAGLALLVAAAVAPAGAARLAIAAVLLLGLFADPAGRLLVSRTTYRTAAEDPGWSMESFGTPTDAAAFLLEQDPSSYRFLGFDPGMLPDPATFVGSAPGFSYRQHVGNPNAQTLIVNNRATALGLPDIQGYNPIVLRRYAEFIEATNGTEQEYHEASIFPRGLTSPLLDMLSAKYVVVLNETLAYDIKETYPGLRRLATAYEGEKTTVLERPTVLPRAWLVHEAERHPYGEALALLSGGKVDPRKTALLEDDPPPLAKAPRKANESVEILAYEPETIRLRVDAAADALLVLSEIYDPVWTATVDGEAAPVLVANHALRAVPVSAGSSVVELRYDSSQFRLGLGLSGAALVFAIGVLGWSLAGRRRFAATAAVALDDPLAPTPTFRGDRVGLLAGVVLTVALAAWAIRQPVTNPPAIPDAAAPETTASAWDPQPANRPHFIP